MSVPLWVRDTIFYQIFPDRFCNGDTSNDPENVQKWGSKPTIVDFQGGDLAGISEKMDYLLDLGINAIYLNPIFLSTSTHRYDTVDYFQIDYKLGDKEDFSRLIEKAHQNNIRVILDGVFNHTGRGFFAFNDILDNGAHSPYRNWYHIHKFPVDAYSPGDAVDYDGWWRYKSLPKLNTDHKPVRDYLFRVGEYWINEGIDGWRLDVPNEIDDDEFWGEFRYRVKRINPEAWIMGEIWEADPRWLDDSHFDSLMNYPLRDVIIGFLNQTLPVAQVKLKIDQLLKLYPQENVYAMYNLLGSHDTERIFTVLKEDLRLVKMAFLFVFSFPGAPAIYYGDEIGITGSKDPDCRKAFLWEPTAWNEDLRNWVNNLIQVRKAFPALREGTLIHLNTDQAKKIYGFIRILDKQIFISVFNIDSAFVDFELDGRELPLTPGHWLSNLLGSEKFVVQANNLVHLSLPPKTAFLLTVTEIRF